MLPVSHEGGAVLELRKTAIGFDEQELLTLEEIVMDRDEAEALRNLLLTDSR